MKVFLLLLIRIYQKFLSFDTGLLHLLFPGQTCRFTPKCSEYGYLAISRYGTIRGIFLTIKRIVRCHPGNKGGWDPIPQN